MKTKQGKHFTSHGVIPAGKPGGSTMRGFRRLSLARLHGLWLLILCLAMVLQACGFKPRGAVELPPVMDNTFIGGVPFDPMVIALRDAFENAGVVVVERKAEATAVLRLLQNSFDRRTLSVDANGKVVEYALQFRVRFDVVDPQDQEVVRPQTVELTRGYLNPDTEVLGKSLEEESLQDEMRRDLARSILRRIQAQLG